MKPNEIYCCSRSCRITDLYVIQCQYCFTIVMENKCKYSQSPFYNADLQTCSPPLVSLISPQPHSTFVPYEPKKRPRQALLYVHICTLFTPRAVIDSEGAIFLHTVAEWDCRN